MPQELPEMSGIASERLSGTFFSRWEMWLQGQAPPDPPRVTGGAHFIAGARGNSGWGVCLCTLQCPQNVILNSRDTAYQPLTGSDLTSVSWRPQEASWLVLRNSRASLRVCRRLLGEESAIELTGSNRVAVCCPSRPPLHVFPFAQLTLGFEPHIVCRDQRPSLGCWLKEGCHSRGMG